MKRIQPIDEQPEGREVLLSDEKSTEQGKDCGYETSNNYSDVAVAH
jgi:hypothetical protein